MADKEVSPRDKAQMRADDLHTRFESWAHEAGESSIRPYVQYNSIGTAASFGFTLDEMARLLEILERR